MASLNKVTLIGRLGADPVVRHTTTGKSLTTFSLATNTYSKGDDGERREETEWHRVVAWDKLGEICAEHLTTGRMIYVEGRIRTRSWQDGDGNDRYMTEIVARRVEFLSPRPSVSDARPVTTGFVPMGAGA